MLLRLSAQLRGKLLFQQKKLFLTVFPLAFSSVDRHYCRETFQCTRFSALALCLSIEFFRAYATAL